MRRPRRLRLHPGSRHPSKVPYYALTATSSLAASYFFNYLFFYLRDRFGFDTRQNLAVAALHGAIYIVAAWQCGKFAERRGFHTSLAVGFAGLTVCMVAGALAASAGAEVAVVVVYSVVLLFLWPALEAVLTHDEHPSRVPHVVGVYNCTWSATGALSYFTGGVLYDAFGVGAVFWLPAGMFLLQLMALPVIARANPHTPGAMSARLARDQPATIIQRPVRGTPQTFLTLAWIANPLSYVAVYTLLASMPGLAVRLGLSPGRVGLFCSVWMFARMAAFFVLWHWTAWHYRFRWLAGAYLLLLASFATIELTTSLAVVVAAQVVFGAACGLIYYSSLFYSMDVGEAKGEHGGLHEAAIGIGIFAGPALGAAALHFFPGSPHAATMAVSGLLAAGFVALAIVNASRSRAHQTAQ